MKAEIYSKDKIGESVKELVIARIQARMPSTFKLSIGGSKSLTKEEMIEHVKKGDDIGKQIAQVHLKFIKAQATGQLLSAINTI